MPPVGDGSRSLWPLLFVFILAVTAGGCSSSTTTSGLSFVDEQGNHPAGWIEAHPSFARPDGSVCTQCHGSDLQGGIAGVSCFAASRGGQACHAGGPAFHPAAWLDKAGDGTTEWHATAFQFNDPVCVDCHDLTGKCILCHFSIGGNRVPTGSSYVHGNIPDHSVFPAPQSDVCVNCHEVNNRFGHMPQPFCHNCHAPFPVPAGTHGTGWLDSDSAGFHGDFVSQITCETSGCHPISGHPTCTTCHFDNQGSRANASLGFAHDGNVFSNHREESYASVGNICENCHQTSRIFRAGAPPSGCGPTSGHPGDEGCHYNAALLDPVLNNPRF